MKSLTKKKMGAFTCHSQASTAVCMTPDSRSVIVPGRRSLRERNITATTTSLASTFDNPRVLNNNAKYSRLVDHHHHHHRQDQLRTKLNISTNNSTLGDYKKSSSLFLPSIKRELALRNNNNVSHQQVGPLQKPSAILDSVPHHVFQVVVMRVSLHCQGCAGKLKKHLSKMEGVTSFSIELETKRVTVMGHVSPAGVLESISKVRRAEFWPSSACSSSSSPSAAAAAK
ncbi:hypothetical protein L484_024139 [Morus notabilis]|uniref:HMA domain-containing protein n=1 Tax=Morus notabilis TaxID=981085 RepID=W9SBC7_9ROSA|nr:heavy metal-associated isoprenylated plant protein 3 [Morus notabilis]EXB97278.1 hypothetical protein L484_024139 [Morus notabilis]